MGILNSFCLDTLTRVGNEASILCNYMGKKTLQVKDVESAVKLVCSVIYVLMCYE